MNRVILASVLAVVLSASTTHAQRKPKITWETAVKSIEARVEPANAAPGQTVTLSVIVRLFPEHWTYPTKQTNPNESETTNKFDVPKNGDLIFMKWQDPKDAHKKPSPEGGDLFYYPDGATW